MLVRSIYGDLDLSHAWFQPISHFLSTGLARLWTVVPPNDRKTLRASAAQAPGCAALRTRSSGRISCLTGPRSRKVGLPDTGGQSLVRRAARQGSDAMRRLLASGTLRSGSQ